MLNPVFSCNCFLVYFFFLSSCLFLTCFCMILLSCNLLPLPTWPSLFASSGPLLWAVNSPIAFLAILKAINLLTNSPHFHLSQQNYLYNGNFFFLSNVPKNVLVPRLQLWFSKLQSLHKLVTLTALNPKLFPPELWNFTWIRYTDLYMLPNRYPCLQAMGEYCQ